MSDQPRTLIWNFNPSHPVSPDDEGGLAQKIFLTEWQERMRPKEFLAEVNPARYVVDAVSLSEGGAEKYPILGILQAPDEHATQLASNFIRFLGTEQGRGFLSLGQDFAGIHYPYLSAFAVYNISHSSKKGGLGLRDILASDFANAAKVQCTDDVRTLEAVALWLGTPRGGDFIHRSRIKVSNMERAARRSILVELNSTPDKL